MKLTRFLPKRGHANAVTARRRPQILSTLRDDLDAALAGDPAARNLAEVALLYPGVHAVWSHRISHALWTRGAKFPARALSQMTRAVTNIEIHPGATLGPRLFIDHGAGVVIGETAEVGADVTLYHGVTLGGMSLEKVKRHPTLGDGVMVGAGAKILGPITVGDGTRIGANSVLIKSVEPGSVVVGVPGQVVAPKPKADTDEVVLGARPAAVSDEAPDPLAFAVRSLLRRVEQLESATESGTPTGLADSDRPGPLTGSPAGGRSQPTRLSYHRPDGVWEPQDYVI